MANTSSNNNNNNNLDAAPISQLAKRRSTVASLGQTEQWELSQRRGHSAMYAGIESLNNDYRTLYIGATGNVYCQMTKDMVSADTINQDERDSLKEMLQSKYNMVPIFVPDKIGYGHYEGYCKQVLWPLLHYVMWNETVDEKSYWEDYVAVNRIFAEEVAKHYEDGDLVSIHDYHLLLVPRMLREMLPDARIGIFIHTPFVSSEIFRCLPRRKDILLGMLGSNLVSFQTYNYARHFSSNCTRILGYEYTPAGIDANGSMVCLGVHPIGIDVQRVREHCHRQGVQPKMEAMKAKYGDKKIIVGRDKLDPVKGVLQKLDSFEQFLKMFPEWRDRCVLIQVTSPGVIESPKLEAKAIEIVNRINAEYGSLEFSPVSYFHQHIDRDEYYALLCVADAMLVTPTSDGMNTTSLEFVVAQEETNKSPLVLSEFTGTAGSLSAAEIVNPWDYAQVADALYTCLAMSDEEKQQRFKQTGDMVNRHTASYWAHALVQDLVASAAKESHWGPTPALDVGRLQIEYNESRKRLLFFDYDGTLTPICDKPDDAKPSSQTLSTLERLAADPHNVVMVVSGRDQETLEKWLGHIPNLGLSGEHGCFIRDPGRSTTMSMLDQVDMSWKDDVMEVFKYYTERTPGSFVENKRCALTWHYRTADPKFGAFQAKECQNHLEQSIISKLPVEILVGKKTLEVRPTCINKGEVIKRGLANHPDATFLLCAGDDKTDEDMFRVLAQMKSKGLGQLVFTVMIGPPEKHTVAIWHVESSQEFNRILASISS
ncbi:glycosyltransferase family 20-domain-containing protein [Zychaea mexicana]|uniref:glycosyltransferase family 20-domain-containing protein n=1 Tax=Zychaea mexicana TaxID=64656 RepID=UPI0022FEDDED|nr:glycosyltransferase family 20-domain-containing protein [Zychaea mexicana]KAI9499125.1 glycosyltransferase family 20-domain-containing protein [Zychaea mexicana]